MTPSSSLRAVSGPEPPPAAYVLQGHSKPVTGDMGQGMTRGMKETASMSMSNDTDHDFAMMMRPHHQSRVDVAEFELQSGKDPKLRSMANIISSQKEEVKKFDNRFAKHEASERRSSAK